MENPIKENITYAVDYAHIDYFSFCLHVEQIF
jgi:hypothetical protein